ncbi:MAG: hypothetical protein E6F97_03210 [Actinobacteria bacterium]|nr:MAG: hypothetical protein E6F97_03210 [Actinomycetota bacterium]
MAARRRPGAQIPSRPVEGFDYVHEEPVARSLEDLTLVVARVEIDFRAPVGFPEVVEVGVRAGSFGRKSFGLDHELRVRGELVAEAKTVLVAYDYGKAETVTIPETWREKLAA